MNMYICLHVAFSKFHALISCMHDLLYLGPPCAAENIRNFTQSTSVTVPGGTVCFACLFNESIPRPGTVWFSFGDPIARDDPFAQVNANGTLVFMLPAQFTGVIRLTCQSNGNAFDITLIGRF